jgi:protein-S-isoprenylcysteine O-methyltransferase Ste14
MMPTFPQLSLLALSWLAYFVFHSLFASLGLKTRVAKRWPKLMPFYRISFNLLAVILLLIPLWLLHTFQGDPLWQWQGYEKLISSTLRYSVIIGFVWTLKYYDGSELAGIRQLRNGIQSVEDQERFHISPFHRFVRHPWYFFALIYIWSGNMEPAWLVSAVMLSLYCIVGSRLEERKLVTYHGEVYKRYARAVPGLIPRPWRFLNRTDAQNLMQGQGEF